MVVKRMMTLTRPVPEPEFQNIVSANTDLVQIAKSLNELADEIEKTDPVHARRLREAIIHMLDKVDTISDSMLEATKLAVN